MFGRYTFEWDRLEKSLDLVCKGPYLRYFVERSTLVGQGYVNFSKLQDIRNNYFIHRGDKSTPEAGNRIRHIGGQTLMRLLSTGVYDALRLASLVRDFDCSVPKDKVFALAALMDNRELSAIGNYSLSTADIYTRFARDQVQQGKLFAILDLAGLSKRKLQETFPTWVPDWTSQRPVDGIPRPISGMRNLPYSASKEGTIQPPTVVETKHNCVAIWHRGHIIDAIREVRAQQRAPGAMNSGEDQLLRWLEDVQSDIKGSTSHCESRYGDINDAIARLLTIDDQYTGGNAIPWSVAFIDPAAALKEAINVLQSRRDDPQGDVPSMSNSSAETYIMQMKAATNWRAFAITETGYIALVPSVTKAGDKVIIFEGASVPYVLRPSPGDEGFLLVGDSYVQGVMYGEAQVSEIATLSEVKLR